VRTAKTIQTIKIDTDNGVSQPFTGGGASMTGRVVKDRE
jgi:hypothetical protein